jgi:iron(III) transport system ATP-binding protein
MAAVTLANIFKSYGSTKVVEGLDLQIHDGEFVALLGPSGCGKTTTLRMIAGLEAPDAGTITIGDEPVSDPSKRLFVPPERRRLGMVFQSYAVWPHMSVSENVAYPLALAKVPKPERAAAVDRALAMVQLAALGARMPNQLSGGQQQRVALARALVSQPRVLLLDEPLSNLDVHLREDLRREIDQIRKKLGVTVVFVTHDQEEALALADRIVVMHKGRVCQAGTPAQVYGNPSDEFVASFVGKATFLPARVTQASDTSVTLDFLGERALLTLPRAKVTGTATPNTPVKVMVRPEAVRLVGVGEGLPARVVSALYLGDRQDLVLQVGEGHLRAAAPLSMTLTPHSSLAVTLSDVRLFPAS